MASSKSNRKPKINTNHSNTAETGGKVETRQRQVAMLLASGLPVKEVETQTGMSASRIYHLLAERDSFVNREIHRIQNETLAENTRILPNLFFKALRRLDLMLEGADNGDRLKAINQIIKICNSKNGIPRVTTPDEKPESIDEIIIRKRRERGLEPYPSKDGDKDGDKDDDKNGHKDDDKEAS